jgi:endonuclease III
MEQFRYNALAFFYLTRNKRMPAPALADQAKVSAVHLRLVETYGRLTLAPGGDPLDELIGTILSQNTSDVNSGRAYAQLRAMYPTWDEV